MLFFRKYATFACVMSRIFVYDKPYLYIRQAVSLHGASSIIIA